MQLIWLSLVPIAVSISYFYRIIGNFFNFNQENSPAEVVKYSSSDLWGTYRSNLYFGMRTKTPQALMTGLAWNSIDNIPGFSKMRHSCELDDQVNFGWREHDGRSYGRELITDQFHQSRLSISYLKVSSPLFPSREAWSVKIKVSPVKKEIEKKLSLIFYLGYEGDSSMKLKSIETGNFKGFTGWTAEIGNFAFGISKKNSKSHQVIYDQIEKSKIWMINEKYSKLMRSNLQEAYKYLGNEIFKTDLTDFSFLSHGSRLSDANLLSYQFILKNTNEEFEIFFFPLDGKKKDAEIQIEKHLEVLGKTERERRSKEFHEKVLKSFKLNDKSKLVPFVKYAVSNLLGGISYFYGDSQVFSSEGSVESIAATSLFTDVPARANFPRGFYWDSGFHNILIGKWDANLSVEILSNWIEKIDEDGWIGREQILGDEARSKVPTEYITQNRRYSNPPAPLLPIEMLSNFIKNENTEANVDLREIKIKLKKMYPKLVKHFNWFLRTQRGNLLGSPEEEFLFRWRGRSDHHTLTSGLDDYPRGNIPSNMELHVDLLSWMAFAARALSNIKTNLGLVDDDSYVDYDFDEMYKLAIRNLNQYHWDESRGCYSDLTVNDDETGLMFVPNVGYVSLFPMFFGLVPVNDPKLDRLFNILEDPQQLWTDYGIRSLSKSDSFYNQGDKYWTGPIWINLNYLILSSLKKYYYESQRARSIYSKLRTNLIENMSKEWKRTGFIWEQYNDLTGAGQRSRPFSGWSSLIALIIAEDYH